MRRAGLAILFLCLGGIAASLRASAGTILYDNTVPGNTGNLEAWGINEGFVVSDSFTLGAGSTITGATFDSWVVPGNRLLTVEWSLGSTPFGDNFGTGTASATSSGQVATGLGFYAVDFESIPIPSVALDAGAYWFTLQNAVTANGVPTDWDISNGPSTAFGYYGDLANGLFPGTNSETFQIVGYKNVTTAPTPEPSGLFLLGSGLAGLGALIRCRIGSWKGSRGEA